MKNIVMLVVAIVCAGEVGAAENAHTLFTSGYTTNALMVRLPDFTFTHSRCRGDFSSASLAHGCAKSRR